MWFIELGAICVTVAVVVRVWWLVVQVLRARNKRRLLSRMFGVVSDSPDFIGISAICHDIDSVSQVADLLDVEYASYELLVVMDARLKPELFHEMLRHYRMMRVDYHPFEACSQLGVRGFYRSQTRGVNRLTLLDQMEAFSAVSSDAAVRAASYDYILPIGRNLRLKRGAIDRLAMELAVHPIHSISFVRTAVGPSLRLYAREYVGRLGRFDRADGYELSRKERCTGILPLPDAGCQSSDAARSDGGVFRRFVGCGRASRVVRLYFADRPQPAPQTGCDRPSGDGVGGSSDPLYIVRADCRRTFAATLCPGVCRPVGSFRPGRRV